MSQNTIELPVLREGFAVAENEVLAAEISGVALHLLKWLVAEGRTNCKSLAEAIDECITQGFKYHKRLADAEDVRKVEKKRAESAAQFNRWCELNAASAKDPIMRGYMQYQFGLIDPVMGEMFKVEVAKRAEAAAKAKADAEKKKAA